MARAGTTSSERIRATLSSPISAYPFTLACWVRSADNTAYESSMGLSNIGDSVNNRTTILNTTDQKIRCSHQQNATVGNPTTSEVAVDDQWYHVAIVVVSDTLRRFYIDGVYHSSNTLDIPMVEELDTIDIGSVASTAGNSTDVAEAGVWTKALLDSEIELLASGRVPIEVAADDLISYISLRFTTDTEVGPAFSGSYTVTDHPPQIHSSGPIHHWKFDGDLTDSGSGACTLRDLTEAGSLTYISGPSGQAIQSDSTNYAHVQVSPTESSRIMQLPLTLFARVYIRSRTGTFGNLLRLQTSGAVGGVHIYWYVNSSNRPSFAFANDANSANQWSTTTGPENVVSYDQWSTQAVTVEEDTVTSDITVRYYIDGALVTTDVKSGVGWYNHASNVVSKIRVGQGSGTNYIDGDFDDVRIYDRKLSDAEIEEIHLNGTLPVVTPIARYNFIAGSVNDVSGNDYHATSSGSPTVKPLSVIGDSQGVHRDVLEFDGTDDYLDLTSHAANLTTDEGAFVCRFRVPSTQVDTDVIVSAHDSSAEEYWRVEHLASGVLSVSYDDSGGGTVSQITRDIATNDDKWHTLAVEWGAEGYRTYLDGKQDTHNWTASSGAITDTYGPDSPTSVNQFYIGRFTPGTPLPFEGELSEVRFYDQRPLPSDHETIHLEMLPTSRYVLVVGDDNAINTSTGTASTPSNLVVSDDGDTAAQAADPLNHQDQVASSVGFEIDYCSNAAGRLGDKEQFRVIPCGKQGSASSDWLAGDTNLNSSRDRWNRAWSRGNSNNSIVDVIVISLGTHDTADATTAAAVETNVTTLINNIRTSGDWLGVTATTPVVLVGLSFTKLTTLYADIVDNGLRAVAWALDNCQYLDISEFEDDGSPYLKAEEMADLAIKLESNRQVAATAFHPYGEYRPAIRIGEY